MAAVIKSRPQLHNILVNYVMCRGVEDIFSHILYVRIIVREQILSVYYYV